MSVVSIGSVPGSTSFKPATHKKGLFARFIAAVAESRRRQAEAHIAARYPHLVEKD